MSEDKTKTKNIRLYFKGENIYIINSLYENFESWNFIFGWVRLLDTVRTIAVFAKNDILYDAAVLNLLKVGKLDVVDRKRIDEILEEQEFGRSD